MSIIHYRELLKEEIELKLFRGFNRYQEVEKCWRKEKQEWKLKDVAFTEQWGADEYEFLLKCLQNTVKTRGIVLGAFLNGRLIGFASVENGFFGSKKEYVQLSSIHISYESRGMGIGKELFRLVSRKAKAMGAKSLYISAHSSMETIAFYKNLGCVEAKEYSAKLVEEEPFDCQLEYPLVD